MKEVKTDEVYFTVYDAAEKILAAHRKSFTAADESNCICLNCIVARALLKNREQIAPVRPVTVESLYREECAKLARQGLLVPGDNGTTMADWRTRVCTRIDADGSAAYYPVVVDDSLESMESLRKQSIKESYKRRQANSDAVNGFYVSQYKKECQQHGAVDIDNHPAHKSMFEVVKNMQAVINWLDKNIRDLKEVNSNLAKPSTKEKLLEGSLAKATQKLQHSAQSNLANLKIIANNRAELSRMAGEYIVKSKENEQLKKDKQNLVALCFEFAYRVWSSPTWVKVTSRDELFSWIAGNLKVHGFKTRPGKSCAASLHSGWVLDNE